MSMSSDRLIETSKTVSFAHRLATSDAFKTLFREGMNLVEESAAYLDGPGREDARQLAKPAALAYASESMRLTTRLMQLASWLLLQRAVNEGEMTQMQAASEKHKVRLTRQDLAMNGELFEQLPDRLQTLSLHSLRLQSRIMCLDEMIYNPKALPSETRPSALESQFERLRRAFAQRPALV